LDLLHVSVSNDKRICENLVFSTGRITCPEQTVVQLPRDDDQLYVHFEPSFAARTAEHRGRDCAHRRDGIARVNVLAVDKALVEFLLF
jgi:hypothetical protein